MLLVNSDFRWMRGGIRGLALLASCGVAPLAAGQLGTWDGSEADDFWFNPLNWDNGQVPNAPGESALVGAPSPTIINGSVNIDALTVTADGDVTLNEGFSLDLTSTPASVLTNNGTITTLNNTDLAFVNTVTNAGQININAGGNQTDIELRTDVSLTGGGTITLSGANAGVNDITGTQVLTIVDQTIQGEGNLGRNTILMVNQAAGLIDANVNGGTLTVDPANTGATLADFDNQGILRASNGGTLQITGNGGGSFGQTGGVIEALAGSEVQFTADSLVTGGTVRSVGSGVVRVLANQSATFTDLTLDGSVIAENNTDFQIGGTINNTGTININAGANSTDIELQVGGATLTGGGTIILSGANAGIDDFTGTQTLTIDDQTLVGEGNLGRNTIFVVNNGTIGANVLNGTLTIDPANVGVGLAGFTNNGLMRASIGDLLFTGNGTGSFDNTNGIIESLGPGEVQFTADSSITGGTIRAVATPNNGAIRVLANQSASFFDLTFEGPVIAENNTDFQIGGTINNTGTININAGLSSTDIELQDGGATLTGGGTVVLSGANAGIDDNTGTQTLTIADQTIRGEGNLGRNTILVVNQTGNLIDADVNGGTLTLDPANGATAADFDNQGTLRASNGGTLELTGNGTGSFSNTGIIEARAGSTVQATSGGSIAQLVEGGAVGDNITAGQYRAFDGTLNVAQADFDARFNSGILNFFGNSAQTNLFDESASSAGNIVSNAFSFNDGSVTVQGGANLTTNAIDGVFNNAGTVNIFGSSTFAVNDGAGNGEFINGSPTTLTGTGTLRADLTNDFGGVTSPGINSTTGTLTVDGDATFGVNGTLRIHIADTADNDQVAVTGTLSLNGALEVVLASSFAPADGEQFLIMTAAANTITGDFAAITDNSAGYDFVSVIDSPNGNVFLQAVLIPEPGTVALLLAGGTLLLRRKA